ncbi:AMP-binding protein [Paracoccus laeviglucosivorans]|uniref:Crotonobetaine/carnitine-CoA ligase n=1 Tax=Paracoccus laeviglucosivorans TaxID=1197861 RepID=A0A521BIT4_9RHOB|nr:AMP-binding protein [Paracoccus laeviglucosivorans]SMO47005.1 crotonobetaine/carnitine-CoA ligase [Paracoccus laeviglucosivorans]
MFDWEGDGFLHLMAQCAKEKPDRVFATEFAHEGLITHRLADILRRADRLAAGLAERGIGKGDRVACMMETHSDYICAVLAVARLGAIWVPVGTRLMPANLDYIFAEAGVQLVLAETALAEVVAQAGHPDLAVIQRGEGGLDAVLGSDHPLPLVDVLPSDILMISFTSGTTGRPKSVPVTHAMMRFSAEAAARSSQSEPGAVLYVWEPFHHIGGAQLIVLPLIRDVTLALTQRFTASGFWDQVRACGATRIHHLGGILQMLLKQPPSPRDRDHPVTVAWGGGCTADVWAAFSERFGVRMVEGYGMTEASSLTTINDEGLPGYVGRALPWFDVRILDPEGHEVPRGTRGEIVVAPIGKGAAALFTGYLNSESATRETLRNGRLHTGDQGEMDADGRVRFHGRLKDTIRVRGENVSAWEVEHVVEQHSAVAACAVIPVKAEIGEADIKLFIQLAPGIDANGAEIFDWLRTRLAPHQLPRHIAFIPAFERTPSQRIMKHTLDATPAGDWIRT